MKELIGMEMSNFNTSHVLIYQYWFNYCIVGNFISIHLMFLFIDYETDLEIGEEKFQYISCSYLSVKAVLEVQVE